MVGPPRPEHHPKLRPVLGRSLGPSRKGHRRAVHPHQPAAAIHKIDQVLPQRGIREKIADIVIEKYRIELLQALGRKHRRVPADHRRKRPGLFPHPRKRKIGRRDRAVPAIPDIQIEDQQLPGPLGRSRRLARQRRLHLRLPVRPRRPPVPGPPSPAPAVPPPRPSPAKSPAASTPPRPSRIPVSPHPSWFPAHCVSSWLPAETHHCRGPAPPVKNSLLPPPTILSIFLRFARLSVTIRLIGSVRI